MVEWAMSLPWWNRDRESKYARIINDTHVTLSGGGSAPLKKGALISPVRKAYLPRDHRWSSYYDETKEMVADTPAGFGKVSLEDVEW